MSRLSTSSSTFIVDVSVGISIAVAAIIITIVRLIKATKQTYREALESSNNAIQVYSPSPSLDTSFQQSEDRGSMEVISSSRIGGQLKNATVNDSINSYMSSSRSSMSVSLAIYTVPSQEGIMVDIAPHQQKQPPSYSKQSTPNLTQSQFSSKQYPLQRANSQRTSSLLLKDTDEVKFETNVRKKWKQPFEELSTHIDLPRLITKMEVFSNGKKIWPQIIDVMNETEKEPIILSLLLALSSHLDNDEQTASINKQFGRFFDTPSLDVSKKLMALVISVLGPDSKTTKVLKACNQSIIASSVVRMKNLMHKDFPYLDLYGAWKIIIQISDDDIQIAHYKWEKSYVEGSFQFEWQFKMIFDTQLEDLIKASLSVVDLRFGVADDLERRVAFKKLITQLRI